MKKNIAALVLSGVLVCSWLVTSHVQSQASDQITTMTTSSSDPGTGGH